MGETMFFERREVSVSNARFVVRGRTYPICFVTSAKLQEKKPSPYMALVFGVIGLGIYLAQTPATLIASLVSMAIAILLAASRKKQYVVVLDTPSGQFEVFNSTDREYVELIVGAINRSIVHQE